MTAFSSNHKELGDGFVISLLAKLSIPLHNHAMRTHGLILILLAMHSLACTRKMIQVPINAPVKPAAKKENATANAPTPADDSLDLANQLRDPDLLNRLDDPSLQGTQKPAPKPNTNKPVVIKGSDLPPEPPNSKRPTPAPPLPPINGATGGKTPGSGN